MVGNGLDVRGGAHPANIAPPRFAHAIASSSFEPGTIVKASASPFLKVTTAADGDPVYGVAVWHGEDGVTTQVLIEGETWVKAKSTASWTTHRRVCAAGSNEVDQGSTDDPFFATLIEHDATNNKARIYVHADAMPRAARSLVDSSDVSWPLGALTAGRPLVLGTTSRVASPLHIGATGDRPASPYTGQNFFDSDVGEQLVYDGTRWRSATYHKASMGRLSAVGVASIDLSYLSNQLSTDTGLPWVVEKAARIVEVSWGLRAGTGGKTWTLSLRTNGSGSDAWTGSGQTSSTSWQRFNETVGLALTAGTTVRALATISATTEALQVAAEIMYVYT